MNPKVTKMIVKYPEDQIPNIIIPTQYKPYRYLIGKDGRKPLVALCMNPSAANDDTSDKTVNKVIRISKELHYDGWFVVNIYPERATKVSNLGKFDEKLSNENIGVIEDFLLDRKIKEVWGAWGNLKSGTLRKGKKMMSAMLKKHKIKVFHFADVTTNGEPRHPLYLTVVKENKREYVIE